MSITKKKWRTAFLPVLAGFVASLINVSSHADAASDYEAMCEGCHSSPAGPNSSPYPIDLSSFTNSTIKIKINNDMPSGDTSACINECAVNLANYILPPSSVEPPEIKDQLAIQPVGTGPLTVNFLALQSTCMGIPCTLEWDFGDGTTGTQVSYSSRLADIATLQHTFTAQGTHPVTIKLTDFLGQTDESVEYIYVVEEESFADYVDTCKEELGFNDNDIPNDLNCTTGHLFGEDGGSAINDFTDYRSITNEVDLIYACRWLQNGEGADEVINPPFILAISIEMLMHNRENGKTCFFKSKLNDIPVTDPEDIDGIRRAASVNIVSPTVAANALPDTTEYNYWDEPLALARSLPCADCHVAGPYIASPRIAPFLQRFGLMNDGHDTYGRALNGELDSVGKYEIVGETFNFMNHVAALNNEQDTCASGCHSVGYNSNALDVIAGPPPGVGVRFLQLLPSISNVINSTDTEVSVAAAGVMPVNAPPIGSPDTSDYTWINRDNPFLENSPGDNETFVEAQQEFSELLSYCGNPGNITAHVVDSDVELQPAQFSDELSAFNAQDGVVCVNSEQSDGQCNDFRVRYQCTDSAGDISMTNWYNTDSPSYSGDFERRSSHANVCTGRDVTGIEVSSNTSTGWSAAVAGPVDRLAQFDRYGLVCNNSEQIDGQCANYVVKFTECSEAPTTYTARLSNVWSVRVLTATDTYNNAETRAQPANASWNSQDWTIEPDTNTGYVRLKNVWTGLYLNVESENESARVVTYEYMAEWGSQQWIMEPVSGSSNMRLKNVWTGKYLTVTDNGDYSAILSQSLNPSWDSQKWQVN